MPQEPLNSMYLAVDTSAGASVWNCIKGTTNQTSSIRGNHHCNWSVPYQNCCILLQCHQLSMCQNAGEQDIKDLLGETVTGKVEMVLFHHQSYPQKKERMVNAWVDRHNMENLFSSTGWTRKIHLRHLLWDKTEDTTTNTRKTVASSFTTTTAATTIIATTTTTATTVTTNVTNATVLTTVYETTAKASEAPGGSDLLAEAMSSTAPSPTSGNSPASTSSRLSRLVTTIEKSGNSSSVSVLSPISTSAPLTVISEAGTQMPQIEQFNSATTSTPRRSSSATVGAGLKTLSTRLTTLVLQNAGTSSTASTHATALTPLESSYSAYPQPVVTLPYLEPEASTAATALSKSTFLGSTRGVVVFTTGSTAETTTGPMRATRRRITHKWIT
nr:uncharacterized protein C11orf24 homolog isoform X2 [Columba livia]